jgi:hypothetical protein
MDPLEVLDAVRRAGSSVRLAPDGRFVVAQPSMKVWSLLAANRALLHAVLLGAQTGHVWGRCNRCGEGRLIRNGTSPRCVMTPGCEGRHLEPTP